MMHDDILAKAEREKIKGNLEQAMATLVQVDGIARQQKAQAVIDAVVALRAKGDEIQTRIKEFNDASDARALQIKAEIEAKLANLQQEVSKLSTKVKSQSTTAR